MTKILPIASSFSLALSPSLLILTLIIALMNFYSSQLLFTRQTLLWLYKLQSWLATFVSFEMDLVKLQKMYSLWPPPIHPFPYMAHALATCLTLKTMFCETDSVWSPVKFTSLLRNSMTFSIASSICSLGAQKASEMHWLVIALNLAHCLLLNLAMALIICTTIHGIKNARLIFKKE